VEEGQGGLGEWNLLKAKDRLLITVKYKSLGQGVFKSAWESRRGKSTKRIDVRESKPGWGN